MHRKQKEKTKFIQLLENINKNKRNVVCTRGKITAKISTNSDELLVAI